jgi:[ribosomal protein S18]-alanine N-acetyltransferase
MSAWDIGWFGAGDSLDDILAIDRVSFPHPWTRQMYEEELATPDRSRLAVARVPSGRLAGYISFWLVVDELHVNNVAVTPGARQHGLGTALVQFALREGAASGAGTAFLEVRASNQVARALYLRLGFREAGRRARYYPDPEEDAVVMVRSLRNLELNPVS